jgi:DNA-binding NarL/FixJ family response regulator
MIPSPFGSTPAPERADFAPLPLVGRENEMSLLRRALKSVTIPDTSGTAPRAVFVAGAAGVGKTRLLRGLADEAARQGVVVLWGGAYESGLLPPYLPFIEALRPYLRSLSTDELRLVFGLPAGGHGASGSLAAEESPQPRAGARRAALPNLGLQCLARLFPQIAALLDPASMQDLLTSEQEKFGLLDGIAALLERITTGPTPAGRDAGATAGGGASGAVGAALPKGQPLLLCLDDLQWADSASLELVLYLTARLRSARLLLLGAFRSDALAATLDASANSALARAIAELSRQRLFTLLQLSPLSEGASSVLLESLLPGGIAPDLQQAILTRAEGNPFFIEELVRALQSSGQIIAEDGLWQRPRGARGLSGALPVLPTSIQMTLSLRLEPLSQPCRQALACAALCGATFYPDVLAAATSTEPETLLDLLDEASAAGLIAPAETDLPGLPAFRFTQRIARELLAGQVKSSRRKLHAALAEALQARSRTREAAARNAAEIAHHYTQAGRIAEAIHWTVLAGDVAAGRHAQREAIGHYRSALSLLENAPDTTRSAVFQTANRAEGEPLPQSSIRQQDAGATEAPLPFYTPGLLHWRLGESWFRLGEFQPALKSFQAALDEYRQSGDALSLARLNRLVSDAYRQSGQYDLAFSYLFAAQEALAQATPPANEFAAEGLRPGGEALSGHFNGRIAPEAEQILLHQSRALLLLVAGQGPEAEEALRESQRLAVRVGDRSGQATALHLLGWIKGWSEHITQAIQLQAQARDLLMEIGDPFHAVLGYQGLGIVYQAIGDSQRASAETEAGLKLARLYGTVRNVPWLRFNQGVLALAQGRWQEAQEILEEARESSERWDDARLKPILQQALGVLHWRTGRPEQAEQAFYESYQAAQISEWFPSSAGLLGWFLALNDQAHFPANELAAPGRRPGGEALGGDFNRRGAARPYLEQATSRPLLAPVGFAADFYLPFVAEGWLVSGNLEAAAKLAARIKPWCDRQYYGVSAARILGAIAAAQGRWTDAQSHFAAALELCRRAGSRPEQACILLAQGQAALAQASAMPARASMLVDEVERVTEEAEQMFSTLGQHTQAARAAALRAEAMALPQQAATSAGGKQPIDPAVLKGLTPRELEVLRQVAEGKTDKEIAEVLVISPRTANRHIANIFLKLDVTTRAAAAAYAIRNRLV